MLFFSPIFIYLYAWPHVSPWCAGKVWVAVQMRLDIVILAAGTVRIAIPITDSRVPTPANNDSPTPTPL